MQLVLIFVFLHLALSTKGQQNPHDAMFAMFKKRMQAFENSINNRNGMISSPVRHHHESHRHYNRKTHSKVVMPSGSSYIISKPKASKYICANKSDLVTMRPNDKKWKNEYLIVKGEMMNTKRDPFLTFDIVKIQKVFNPCLWRKYKHKRDEIYEEFKVTNERMLFHGSAAARELALHGFDERYANMNGNFGAGIYFADRSSKSNSYTKEGTDGTRKILLSRVTLGKEHSEMSPKQFAHAPVGSQSVVGRMMDTEYIVYRGEQAYPAYLITYRVNMGFVV